MKHKNSSQASLRGVRESLENRSFAGFLLTRVYNLKSDPNLHIKETELRCRKS